MMSSGGMTAAMALLGVLAVYVGIKVVAFLFKLFFFAVGAALILGACWWVFTSH
ncbi:MAG TPA: hypothetical protein VHI52_03705 [Verrucomicrobiae bacterium]|nr:hypothetical protein [Verrucomicrobiae bacterium]